MNKIVEYRNNNMGKGKAIFSKIILVSVFFLAAALISCNGGLSEKPDVKESDSIISEYVQIGFKLSVPEFEDRKAIPNSSSYSNMVYVLTGLSDGGQEETLGTWGSLTQLRNATLTIHTGQWRLTLTSYLNTSSNYDYYDYEYGYSSSSIGYDSAKPILQDTIELILTQSSTLAFTLKEVENCKVNGSFEYTVNYNDSRSENWSLSAKLLNVEDLSQTEYSISYSTSSSYTRFTCSNLPSGNYLLQIQFIYKNGDTSFESYTMPLIQIAAGLKTTGSKTLSAGELTRFYSINYSYLENGVMPENSVSTYTPYKAVVLENPTRTNYKFLGWYYSTDWTDENKLPVNSQGKYILNQNHDLTGNVTVYARWQRNGYEQDGFEWHLSDEGVLTISGTGEMPFCSYDFPEWQDATSVIIEEGITEIHNRESYSNRNGFGGSENSKNIKTITLPSTLMGIPRYCFYNCSALETINIPDSVESIGSYALSGCIALKSISLPKNITTISEYVFRDCVSISDITVPASVTSLDRRAFTGWTESQQILLDWNSDDETERTIITNSSTYTTAPNAHYKDGVSPWFSWSLNDNGVLTIRGNGEVPFYAYDFSEWQNATSVVVEEGVTGFNYSNNHSVGFSNAYYYDWGNYTHTYTQNIKSISLPKTLTSIPSYCFCDCTSLESINIPDNVESIGSYAFSGCTALKSITVPKKITTIDEYTFQNCTAIESIILPDNITTLYRNAFRGWQESQQIKLDWNSNDETERSINVDDTDYADAPNAHYKNGKAVWFSWGLSEDYVLTLRGNGEIPFYSNSFSEWQNATSIVVEEGITGFYCYHDTYWTDRWDVGFTNYNGDYTKNVTSIVLPSTLNTIPDYCFYGCTALKSITIPNSVTSIGENAFANCSSLEEIILPSSITSISAGCFYGCSSFESFTIPSSVTSLGDCAFAYCTGISSITVPVTVTEQFNKNVFQGWRSNQTITLDWNSNDSTHAMPSIPGSSWAQDDNIWTSYYNGTHAKYRNGTYAWNGCALNADGTAIIISGVGAHYPYNDEIDLANVTSIIVQEGITSLVCNSIPDNNTTVKTITLPSTLTYLGDSVFEGFAGVEEITIPSSVTAIARDAFRSCTSLKSITIPTGVEGICENTFDGCTSLETVNIPNSVTRIYEYAFQDCTSLEEITLSNALEQIDQYAFSGSGLTSISIPSTVISIDNYAFKDCTSLASVNFNSASVVIPEECFAGCTSLSSVTGTSAITSIGKNAFRGCAALSIISLPSTLTSIDEYAFYKCTGFTALTIPSSVIEIGSSAFDYCTGTQIITLGWNTSDSTERDIADDAFGYAGVIVKYNDGSNYGN